MGGTPSGPAEIGKMQAALRSWLHRVASGGASSLCGMPAPALLSFVCASALSPLIAAMAGIGPDSAAFVGSDILSSIGSGILSGIIAETLEQERSKDVSQARDEADGPLGLDRLSGKVAAEIDRTLNAGDANAIALRAEIASLLAAVDEGGAILRAALEDQGEQVRAEVLAALAELGSDFAEMDSHIGDVVKTTAAIQSKLDDQGEGMRTLIGRSRRQSYDIGGIRKDIGGIRKDVATLARSRRASQLRTGTPSLKVTRRWRHWMIAAAIPGTAVIVALALAVVLPGHPSSGQAAAGASLMGAGCKPQISSVTPFPATQAQHVVIKGTCFGTGGPIAGNFDEFSIADLEDRPWVACPTYQSDPTCGITKWTPTSITLNSPTGYYGPDGQVLNTDDKVKISVKNHQGIGYCVVIVDQPGTTDCEPGCTPKIDSVSPFAAVQAPMVVIKGSCFGTLGEISAGIDDGHDPFFVIMDNSGARWSGCGLNSAGSDLDLRCTVSHWSPTSITFKAFGDNYRQHGWMVHWRDHLVIKVHNARNYSADTCNVIVGAATVTGCQGNG